jgi:hypothetical protein
MNCKKQNQQSEERVELVQNVALTKDVYEDLKLFSCGDRYNSTLSQIIRALINYHDGKGKKLLRKELFYVDIKPLLTG